MSWLLNLERLAKVMPALWRGWVCRGKWMEGEGKRQYFPGEATVDDRIDHRGGVEVERFY